MAGKVTECRICNSESFEPVLDLGQMPLVDNFPAKNQLEENENKYPLKTVICQNCGLVQLNYVVPKEEMFHENYAYDMSVTEAGKEHFHQMAKELDSKYPDGNSILDIGSNTGVLLEGFKKHDWDILGVEPSANVYQISIKKGIPTKNIFFSKETAKEIREKHGSQDLVTATNVLAHIDNLHGAISGIKEILSEDGVFVFEVPYLLDLVQKKQFDTIYHEHLSYFSIKPLNYLLKQHGLEIIDIEKQEIHGGSLRIHVADTEIRETNDIVKQYIEHEEKIGLHTSELLNRFSKEVKQNRDKLIEMIEKLSSEGKSIAAVGAPAKGVILLNYCGLDKKKIPYTSEKSEIKIDKYVPGTHNKVVSDKELIERYPDYAILLSWNFAESIIDNLNEYLDNGGKFILPIPEPRIIESKNQL